MAFFTISDIKDYVPDVDTYGIQNFDDDIGRSETDIFRLLRIRWWPEVSAKIYDVTIAGGGGYNTEMDTNKLDTSQLKRSGVYHCLAYYILPKLSKFEVDGDRFKEMADYYKARFDEEFDLSSRELYYDWDSDSVFEANERVHRERLKLVR
jgi:hypothetical protein